MFVLSQTQWTVNLHTMTNTIYTVITNGYDTLKDPLMVTPGWEYIAYVDDASKYKSDIWDIREFHQSKSLSASLNNRKKKINIPFKKEGIVIYIDGSMQIKRDLNSFLRKIGHKEISALAHHRRGCVYDEAQQVKKLNKANVKDVDRWINKIHSEGYPRYNGLNQCGLMVRNNTDKVRNMMSEWWEYVKELPRDQLSFNYVMWKNNQRVNTVNLRVFTLYFKLNQHS